MSGSSSVLAWSSALEEFALFRTLNSEQRLRTLNAMVRQDLVRGQMLVAQGGPSDSLFLVLHGALAVRKTGYLEPIAELRAGELVGEIGFFANGPRTADVIAIRDTSVLALTRPAYQKLVEEAPAIVEALLAALARRFAKETARIAPFPTSPKARTVALIDGGVEPLPGAFDRRMREGLAATHAEIIDVARLIRFLCGRAIGFVAAGGGSFGTAHVGIYKAFRERGVMFDIFVGTSVGSAMVAGFAKNLEAEHLERGTHEIFVRSRSFRRPTWPRYALLDHKAFDRALAHQYGADCRIEDCWRPFAAVATNLSTHNLELIRTGPLWQAVRASSAIPGLLPPFYTAEGAMLVDGCLIDNVPLASMHQLKSGPNLVVHFGEPAAEMFDADYAGLPGRLELIAAMLMPFRKKLLPAAPSAVNVLWRSLVAHQRYDTLPTAPLDAVMRPPLPIEVDVTDFDRHTEIFLASYLWARETIAALEAEGNSAITAILGTSNPAMKRARQFAERPHSALSG